METKTLSDPNTALRAALADAVQAAVNAQDAQERLRRAADVARRAGVKVPIGLVCEALVDNPRGGMRGAVSTWLDELHRVGAH